MALALAAPSVFQAYEHVVLSDGALACRTTMSSSRYEPTAASRMRESVEDLQAVQSYLEVLRRLLAEIANAGPAAAQEASSRRRRTALRESPFVRARRWGSSLPISTSIRETCSRQVTHNRT